MNSCYKVVNALLAALIIALILYALAYPLSELTWFYYFSAVHGIAFSLSWGLGVPSILAYGVAGAFFVLIGYFVYRSFNVFYVKFLSKRG